MDSIQIEGGHRLTGSTRIQGSKNATLPILAATLLIEGISIIDNCPRIADVDTMIKLLRNTGCIVTQDAHRIIVDASQISESRLPEEEVIKMRSSIMLMGALLARAGEVSLHYPGGCVIGSRPVDIHLMVLRKLQAEIIEENSFIQATTSKLLGGQVRLPIPSVGATENCILAAVCAEGVTQIFNAAKEPEIVSLCEFLRKAGANIEGEGTSKINIIGVEKLHSTSFRVQSDRIVAGTYLFAGIIGGGEIELLDAPVKQMEQVICVAKRMGAKIETLENAVYMERIENIRGIPYIKTDIYPGFPTDLQSALMVGCTLAKEKSVIEETIFENRYKVAMELMRMGAEIEIIESVAYIKGGALLQGKCVTAEELRGGAALVLAGLAAEGTTTVRNRHFIERGYEAIVNDLRELGANISYR